MKKKKITKTHILLLVVIFTVLSISTIVVARNLNSNQGYRTISVIEVSGAVSIVKDGIEYSAYPGMMLQEGHEIVTSGNSYVRMVLDDDKYVKLEAGSKAVFETLGILDSGKTKIKLERGSIASEIVNPLTEDEEFVINTPNAVLSVRGTFFRVDLGVDKNGDITSDVMTYGGKVASKRVMPTGDVVEEEVLIDAGFKATINMTQEDTHYVVENEEGEKVIVEPVKPEDTDEPSGNVILPIQQIKIEEISDDDLVDIYFAAENGHEMFVPVEEVKIKIEEKNINLEEKKSVYDKTAEIKQETVADVVANDSKPIAMAPVATEPSKEENTVVINPLIDGDPHVHTKVTKTTEATCTEPGKEVVICSECELVLSETEIEALGHSYSGDFTVDIEPTCIETGKKSKHCIHKNCDSKIEDTEVEALGHSYGEWVITLEPDCETEGEKEHICEVCEYVETEVVEPHGHTYAADFVVDVAPTCVKVGSKSKHCTYEGCVSKSEVTEIAETGHSFGGWSTIVETTCTASGLREHTCLICSYNAKESTDALGHDYATGFTVDTAETCTTAGSKSKHCSRCDSKSEVTEIAALGHDYATEFTVDTAETCTTAGSKSKHCSRCDSKSEVTEIAALGHNYVAKTDLPTDTADGRDYEECSNCGDEINISPIIAINKVNFPDDYIRTYVEDNFNTDGVAGLSVTEIAAANTLQTEEDSGAIVTTLKGVELLTGLTELIIYDASNISDGELDITKNTELTTLAIPNAAITSLDISNNTKLQMMLLTGVDITSLDVSNNSSIAYLYVDNTAITSLDISNNTNLQYLIATGSSLASLNVSGCTGLSSLQVGDTKLTSLDVTNCTMLNTIDVSGCTALSTLDTSTCSSLTTLTVSGSGIESINMTNNTTINTLTAQNCESLTAITVTGCSALSSLDFDGSINLKTLGVGHCTSITSLDISSLVNLEVFNASSSGMTTLSGSDTCLDFSSNVKLRELQLGNLTSFTEINLTQNTLLEIFVYNYMPMATIDLSNCSSLQNFQVAGCGKLTSLDFSNCPNITLIKASDSTALTSITASGCANLTTLNVGGCTKLPSLDLSNCVSLTTINGNNLWTLTDLNVSSCILLSSASLAGTNNITTATLTDAGSALEEGTMLVFTVSSGSTTQSTLRNSPSWDSSCMSF